MITAFDRARLHLSSATDERIPQSRRRVQMSHHAHAAARDSLGCGGEGYGRALVGHRSQPRAGRIGLDRLRHRSCATTSLITTTMPTCISSRRSWPASRGTELMGLHAFPFGELASAHFHFAHAGLPALEIAAARSSSQQRVAPCGRCECCCFWFGAHLPAASGAALLLRRSLRFIRCASNRSPGSRSGKMS